MSTSAAAALRELVRPYAEAPGLDREALAGLLVELARNVTPESGPEAAGLPRRDPRLEELRNIVLGREIELLARLREIIEDPEQLAAAVGRVLPSAIAHATGDARLGQVLAPAFERATESSIRNNPRTLVNIFYPVIVPAIRKSIGEAIDDTFQSLNQALKASLTWRGLTWRWEAWRTGTSFADVVLKHQLVYQVEHVFLIHHHTGLLISHVAAENAASQDPQLVSSMLVAIQDFVRDSFTGAEQQGIDALRLGELTLWSERGPHATLVAVIRGNPPQDVHETMRDVLSRIHDERRQALENFNGDSSGLADVDAHLTECAELRQKTSHSARKGFPWLVAAAGLLLMALAGLGGFRWWQHEQAWQREQQALRLEEQSWVAAVAALKAQPGIVVTEAERHDGKFMVAGLRDPLAADPQQVLERTGIDPARLVSRWTPYEDLDPEFVLKRLQSSLDPPPTVSLAIADGQIVAHGSASSAWLARARAAAHTLPLGAPSLELSDVQDLEQGAIAALRDKIQSRGIHFDTNEPLPAAGQDEKLDKLARDIKELSALAAAMHVTPRVTLTGHSDDTGRGTFNLSLSLSRAGAVSTLLKKRGVDPNLLVAQGAGPLEPVSPGSTEEARSANRRVSFSVGIE